ncbi:MAG: acireductone dioxygenase [Alishewanella sp.]|nr:acireductone dioxygenase [Alishewanella sp.]
MSTLHIFAINQPEQARFVSTDANEISAQLQQQGVQFTQWQANAPIDENSSAEQVMLAYASDIAKLQQQQGYSTVDVISLHPSHPDKAVLRQKFLDEHIHTEDEVRFFVRGQGLFCLHLGDEIYQVLCQQNDLISVPANTPHWFDMGSAPDFTAIRFFNNTEGWVAHFTGSAVSRQFPLLD